MPTIIKQSRGDVYLGNQEKLPNGQFFWSYINTKSTGSEKPHSYSEGQLWIKDPSNSELTEVANRRSLNAAVFRGFIGEDFNGNFKEANEHTQHYLKHPHPGDFWIFDYKYDTNDSDHHFKYNFNKGDILLITKTVYQKVNAGTKNPFREIIDEVDYIKISGSMVDKTVSDLEAENLTDAITELEQRLLYKGEFSSLKEFNALPKGKGWMYLAAKYLRIKGSKLIVPNQSNDEDFVLVKQGDFIYWNGENWIHIRSGILAKDLPYRFKFKDDENIVSFDDFHKKKLESVTNVKEALDVLFTQKAGLDASGKIPYEQLPSSIVNSMVFKGKWDPLNENLEGGENELLEVTINKIENQAPFPIYNKDGSLKETPKNGWFWIVNTSKVNATNIEYKKAKNGKILELNTGDFIVWMADATDNKEAGGKFEVIDNSDRISAIEVETKDGKKTLLGVVGVKSGNKDNIIITVDGNSIVIDTPGDLIKQGVYYDGEGNKYNTPGKKDYIPIYDSPNTLVPSDLYKTINNKQPTIVNDIGFQVGAATKNRISDFYGNVTVHYTNENDENGTTIAGAVNNSYIIDSRIQLKENANVLDRITKIWASNRNRFIESTQISEDEILNIVLPDASSTVVGIMKEATIHINQSNGTDKIETITDVLSENYFTKTYKNGFITDTLTSENFVERDEYPKDFQQNKEEGYVNIGIGRTESEDVDTGEITFWAKSKDENENLKGFYTKEHVTGLLGDRLEHLLNRESKHKTHLNINPTVLKEEIENYIKLPMEDGTLLLWEDWDIHVNRHGIPLMIPAWENMEWNGKKYIGLDTSPITIRINRKAKDETIKDRENSLSTDYGAGNKSTWSYIGSSQEGSKINEQRGSWDDVVSFDAWVEAQRAIATKEAFILPATAINEEEYLTQMDPETLEVTKLETPPKYEGPGESFDIYHSEDVDKYTDVNANKNTMFQRIVPSGTLYNNSEQYYDPFSGKRIVQQTILKDVEMPSKGGVLLTDKSLITGGYWGEKRKK